MDHIPALLERQDFVSPLIYKVYKYLRIIYRNGVSQHPITHYFTQNELVTIVDTLRRCDVNFNEKYRNGYCENVDKRDRDIFTRTVERNFEPSITKQITNTFETFFKSPSVATQGELDVLECIFYEYAEEIFYPRSEDELEWRDDFGLARPFKKTELQLAKISSLFCNMEHDIRMRRDAIIDKAIDANMSRTTFKNVRVREDIPKNLITDYLGGKYKKTQKRKRRKNQKKRKFKTKRMN